MPNPTLDALKLEMKTAAHVVPAATAAAQATTSVTAALRNAEGVVARAEQVWKTLVRSDTALTAVDTRFAAVLVNVTDALSGPLSAAALDALKVGLGEDPEHPMSPAAVDAVKSAVETYDQKTAEIVSGPRNAYEAAVLAADAARGALDKAVEAFQKADQAVQAAPQEALGELNALKARVAAVGAALSGHDTGRAAVELVDAERARGVLDPATRLAGLKATRVEKRADVETKLNEWVTAEEERLAQAATLAEANGRVARRSVVRMQRLATGEGGEEE